MELKFEQYTINGTPEEMATFLKLYELPGTVTKSIDSGNYSYVEEHNPHAEGIDIPASRHF